MPADFYDQLQKVGLLHVIAASGMNITMVGGFLLGMFSLFLKRQLALILTMVGIIFYAFMAGFEASIVRASIMGILVFSAQLTGRQNSSFLALFMAGFLMLFKSPSLIYDIGFQLSFMATLGLIYFRPIFFLNHRVKRVLEKSFMGDDLVTTVSAQVFTLPILLVNFGSYSLISVLVNAIVLWTVPIVMIVGGLSAIAGLIFEPLGYLLSYLSIPFLLYFENVVRIFSKFGSKSDISSLPVLTIVGYYLILLSIVLLLRKKE
jgi:competence protein ComEC